MSSLSTELLESNPVDDNTSPEWVEQSGDWAEWSIPKDLVEPPPSAEQLISPKSVADRFLASNLCVEDAFQKPAEVVKQRSISSNSISSRAFPSPSTISSSKPKLQLFAKTRRELTIDAMDESQPIISSRESERISREIMDESHPRKSKETLDGSHPRRSRGNMDVSHPRRSRDGMDESRAARRRPDRDRDMNESKEGRSERGLDESRKDKKRLDGALRRSKTTEAAPKRSHRTLEVSKGSQRSFEASISTLNSNKTEPTRSPPRRKPRAKASSSRNLSRSPDLSEHSDIESGGEQASSNKRSSSRPRLRPAEDGDDDIPRERSSKTMGSSRPRLREPEGEAGPSARLKRSSRNRREKNSKPDGRRMSDNSDQGKNETRRMSDNSKNRERREGGRRGTDENRRGRDGIRVSDESRRDRDGRRMADGSRKDKEGRKMDESRRKRRPHKREGDSRRERRERVMRNMEACIPPPSKEGVDAEDDDVPPPKSAGPRDVAPTGRRASLRTLRSPFDMQATRKEPDDEQEEESVFETTWQRGGNNRPRSRRSLVGDSMGLSPRMQTSQSSPTTATARRPGRDRRGANVRQSQLVSMVLLHEDDPNPTLEEEEVQAKSDKEEEVGAEHVYAGHGIELTSSEHQNSTMRSLKPALKVAVKASKLTEAGAKAAGKAAGVGVKAAGKAAGAGVKVAGKAVKVMGFRKKKKQNAYAQNEASTAGLIVDDLLDADNVGGMNMWDNEQELDEARH